MEYSEYKKILDEGMVEYVNGGGSIYHMSKALKEYIFSYDNESMAADHKRHLSDKAVQAILKKKRCRKALD